MVLMGVESLISSCFMDEIDASCDEGILITQVVGVGDVVSSSTDDFGRSKSAASTIGLSGIR